MMPYELVSITCRKCSIEFLSEAQIKNSALRWLTKLLFGFGEVDPS